MADSKAKAEEVAGPVYAGPVTTIYAGGEPGTPGVDPDASNPRLVSGPLPENDPDNLELTKP